MGTKKKDPKFKILTFFHQNFKTFCIFCLFWYPLTPSKYWNVFFCKLLDFPKKKEVSMYPIYNIQSTMVKVFFGTYSYEYYYHVEFLGHDVKKLKTHCAEISDFQNVCTKIFLKNCFQKK